MATQTMTEKEMYLGTFEHEAQSTLRLLRRFPPGQLELRPSDKLRTRAT